MVGFAALGGVWSGVRRHLDQLGAPQPRHLAGRTAGRIRGLHALGVAPARAGPLTLLASGDRADYERALPYLERIGAARFFLGAPGLATRMKLINNLCLGAFMATLAEAMVTAEAAGISRKEALDVLAAGGGKSLVLDAKRDKLLAEDYSPHFSVAMIHKDLHFLQELARDLERPVLTGSVVKELFGRAIQQGWGDEDFAAIVKVFAKDQG